MIEIKQNDNINLSDISKISQQYLPVSAMNLAQKESSIVMTAKTTQYGNSKGLFIVHFYKPMILI